MIANIPQTKISKKPKLVAIQNANGIAIPIHAPTNDIAAAILPSFINLTSSCGVIKKYVKTPKINIVNVNRKCDKKNGKPIFNVNNTDAKSMVKIK